jgi:general secretion pathway protein G
VYWQIYFKESHMRRGFTMIELVFVIVILGILASIAIPRLAASRDDARAVSLKSDIGTASQAIPAWYQGQREVSVVNALSVDTTLWQKQAPNLHYQYSDKRGGTIDIRLLSVDTGTTAAQYAAGQGNPADIADGGTGAVAETAIPAGQEPWLIISLNYTQNDGIVYTLSHDLNVTNGTFPMAGRRVIWN